jgi:hypothetical protein
MASWVERALHFGCKQHKHVVDLIDRVAKHVLSVWCDDMLSIVTSACVSFVA